MKACAVLPLLLPSLTIANFPSISASSFGGFHKISHKKINNFIEGIKRFAAGSLVRPKNNRLSLNQTRYDALPVPADNCYKSGTLDQLTERQGIGFVHKHYTTVATPVYPFEN